MGENRIKRGRSAGLSRKNEAALAALLDHLQVGLVVYAPDTSIIAANLRARELLGVSPEQMPGMSMTDGQRHFTHKDGTPLLVEEHPVNRVIATLRPLENYVLGVRRPNSAGQVWVEVNAFPEFDRQKRLRQIVVSYKDISAHSQGEETHHEGETGYKELADLLPQAVFECDLDGNLTFVNRSGLELLGFTPEELEKGISVADVVRPDDRERVWQNLRSLRDVRRSRGNEYVALRKDGTEFPVLVYTGQVYQDDGIVGYRGIVIDITERKQSEDALRQSEERFRALFKGSPLPLILLQWKDGDLVMVDCNEAADRTAKNTTSGLLGRGAKYIFGQEPEFLSRLYECFEERTSISVEYWHRFWNKDQMLYSTVSAAFIPPDLLLVQAQDITERKRMEEALRQSQEAYRDLVENVDDVLYTLDRDLHVTFVSPVVKSVLGYEPSELLGRPALSLVHTDDLPGILEAVQDALSNRLYPSEYRMLTKKGDVRWVRTLSRPIYEGGNLVGVRGVLADVTERRLAEEALRRSEERFKSAAQHSREVVWEVDADGVYTYVSQASEEVLGYKPDEMVDTMHFYDLQAEEGREGFKLAAMGVIARKESFRNRVNKAVTKAGQTVWLLTSGSPILDELGNVKGYVGSDLDITELKEMEKALESANEMLEQERRALVEKNIALKTIMYQIEAEAGKVKQNVQSNIDKLVMPILKKAREKARESDRVTVDLLISLLEDIASPFASDIESKYAQLTARELEICSMIRSGLQSKDIGKSLGISVRTVEKFRQRIRQKLGIDGQDANLTSFLRSIAPKQ